MRRLTGLVLAGAGAFLLVIAIVLPTYITSQLIEFPLNEYQTATLTASDATYFSPVKLTEITGANLRATYTIKGDAAAGNGSTAVWDEFAYTYDTTNNLPVQPMTRTFAFNRATADLVKRGFVVLPYVHADPVLCKQLEEAGEKLPPVAVALSDLNKFAVIYRYDSIPSLEIPDRPAIIETVRLIREHVVARIAALSATP